MKVHYGFERQTWVKWRYVCILEMMSQFFLHSDIDLQPRHLLPVTAGLSHPTNYIYIPEYY